MRALRLCTLAVGTVRGSSTQVKANLELLQNVVGLTPLDINVGVSNLPPTASLLVPSDQDALLNLYITNEKDFGGLTPYYGVVWPSALALCRHVGPDAVPPGSRVLELGCGVGLSGIAAAIGSSPESVLLTDLDPLAVELAQLGAEASGVADVCTCAVRDWHALDTWPEEGGFDVVLGADVIYEPEACDAIAALLTRVLKPGGVFILADGKARRNRALLWEGLLSGGAFQKIGEEEWVTVDEDDFGVGEPRGQLDRRLREESKEQPVVIARFERTSGGSVKELGVC